MNLRWYPRYLMWKSKHLTNIDIPVSKRRGNNVHIHVFMCIEHFWTYILEIGLSTASNQGTLKVRVWGKDLAFRVYYLVFLKFFTKSIYYILNFQSVIEPFTMAIMKINVATWELLWCNVKWTKQDPKSLCKDKQIIMKMNKISEYLCYSAGIWKKIKFLCDKKNLNKLRIDVNVFNLIKGNSEKTLQLTTYPMGLKTKITTQKKLHAFL